MQNRLKTWLANLMPPSQDIHWLPVVQTSEPASNCTNKHRLAMCEANPGEDEQEFRLQIPAIQLLRKLWIISNSAVQVRIASPLVYLSSLDGPLPLGFFPCLLKIGAETNIDLCVILIWVCSQYWQHHISKHQPSKTANVLRAVDSVNLCLS